MDIRFETGAMLKLANDGNVARRKLGFNCARVLRRRLDDLADAPDLEAMHALPGRCHELKGERQGQLSLDLEHPLRLIFRPGHQPLPAKPDGGLDWKRVTAVIVIGIEDTHE